MTERKPEIGRDSGEPAPKAAPRCGFTARDVMNMVQMFRVETDNDGVLHYVVVPAPRFQAQLNRIEDKLDQLLGNIEL